MMQKFRICAGAVKVWSAKLLMGISWWDGSCALPGYRGARPSTQSWDVTFTYAREHGSAVEDVSALRGEPGVQRGTEVHPSTAAIRHPAARNPTGHQLCPRRARGHS